MPDLFGKKQLGRASTGGRFYATPSERVEANAIYFPDADGLLFGVAEYPVEAGNLGAFATEGTFIFEKPNDWIDAVGRKVFFRPSTGEIVNADKKGDVLIGFQVLANVPNDKLGVLLTSGEFSVVIYVTSTADSGAGSLRQAIADAQDGDVILFDTTVFPVGQTTTIYLSSGFNVSKQITINAGAARVKLDAQNNGCYFYVYNGSVNIYSVDFVNFVKESGDGGVLYFSTGSVNLIDNCTFSNCSVARNGGAIYATSDSKSTLNNCAFSSCSSSTNGGGIYLSNSNQNILNRCSFSDCTSGNNSGAVYLGASSQNTLNDCVFEDCSSSVGGAIYSTSTSQNTLNNCAFDTCAAASGGAVYLTNTSQNTLNNCTVANCSSSSYGGAIFTTSKNTVTLNDCTFEDCVSEGNGGAVYSGYSSTDSVLNLDANNCAFINCSSTSNGGGCQFTSYTKNSLNACTFTNCSGNDGGAIVATARTQNTVNNCNFTSCSANARGGVLYTTDLSQNSLNNCTISDCTATTGGGVYSTGTPTVAINNSVFTAAPVYIAGQTVATIADATFDELRITGGVALTISDGITTTAAFTTSTATITFSDGAALTITTSATIGAATFTSDGRGYLATVSGIDLSSATLTNVVACTYGAGLESFTIDEDGATWTADDLTTPILIEEKGDGDVWTTLSDDATGGSYSDSFAIGTTLRAFDGVRFFVASLDAYWQVEPFVVASNGGGGAGDDSPSWTISDATITPNAEEV